MGLPGSGTFGIEADAPAKSVTGLRKPSTQRIGRESGSRREATMTPPLMAPAVNGLAFEAFGPGNDGYGRLVEKIPSKIIGVDRGEDRVVEDH
jgi:hypothetical protein